MTMQRLSPTFAESIYQELRNQILSGELRPGERIAEIDIGQRMGTSQGPVREAFARLREQGLVITLSHRGSYVSEISEEEARDAYNIRRVLEQEALRLAIPRMGEPEYEVLKNEIAEMEEAAKSADLPHILAADMEFHRRIYEWSGSVTLLQCWNVVETKIRKFAIVASPLRFDNLLQPVRSHVALVTLMRAGYSVELERELQNHLEAIWTRPEEAGPATKPKRARARAR